MRDQVAEGGDAAYQACVASHVVSDAATGDATFDSSGPGLAARIRVHADSQARFATRLPMHADFEPCCVASELLRDAIGVSGGGRVGEVYDQVHHASCVVCGGIMMFVGFFDPRKLDAFRIVWIVWFTLVIISWFAFKPSPRLPFRVPSLPDLFKNDEGHGNRSSRDSERMERASQIQGLLFSQDGSVGASSHDEEE